MKRLTKEKPRLDLEIENESTALFLTNVSLRESYDGSDTDFESACDRRELISTELDQDDGFVVRIVMGDLRSAENAEWMGRSSRKLNLADGLLVVSGGASYLEEEDDEGEGEFWHIVSVPKGEYFVTIYHHLPFINGLRIAKLPDWVGFIPYFRATRPKARELPGWLADHAEREGEELGDIVVNESDKQFVDFVVQLRRVNSRQRESKIGKYGFLEVQRRIPKKCPLGIKAIGIAEGESVTLTDAEFEAIQERHQAELEQYRKDVFEPAKKFQPVARAVLTDRWDFALDRFVSELQDLAPPFIKEQVLRLRKEKATGSDLPDMPGLNSVWRLEDSDPENVAVWQKAASEPNVLLAQEPIDAADYLGEVRCEFGDERLTLPPWNQLHIMVDLLVISTSDGPRIFGVRVQ